MFATRRFGIRDLPIKRFTATSSYLVGCMLVSLGIFTSSIGGSWDITNHLLNKPESFFSSPHAMLYAGVATAILGCIFMFTARGYMYRIYRSFHTSTRLVFIGITMLVVAGPVDFAWHSAFGLDGLLSPPHFVLLMGLVISSLGSLIGLILYIGRDDQNGGLDFGNFNLAHDKRICGLLDIMRSHVSLFLPTLGIMPLWLALAGLIGMFSLPFSKTQYFDFNPEPNFGAVVATLGYPLLLSFMLISSFRLGNERLGILSITSSMYMLISTVTVIIPNEWLVHTIPFYIFNLVPIIAVDVLFAMFKHRISYIIGGGVLGSVFLMMQYPLITYVYNEVVTKQAFVWPSLTSSTYFEMFWQLYPFVFIPGFTMGIIGALFANRIIPKNIRRIPKKAMLE